MRVELQTGSVGFARKDEPNDHLESKHSPPELIDRPYLELSKKLNSS